MSWRIIGTALAASIVITVPAAAGDGDVLERWPNGRPAKVGHLVDGHLSGRVKLFDEQGRLYDEADYVEGDADQTGVHIKFSPAGKPTELRTYKDGLQDGKQEDYFDDGRLSVREAYRAGVLDGERRTFYPSGAPWELSAFRNGEQQGPYQKWDAHGKLLEEGSFTGGVPDGLYKLYVPGTARLRQTIAYSLGKRQGETKEYFDDGTVKSVTSYRDDLLDGNARFNHEDGTVACKVHYRAGKRDGPMTCFHRNGSLACDATFAAGKQLKARCYGPDGKAVDWHETEEGGDLVVP